MFGRLLIFRFGLTQFSATGVAESPGEGGRQEGGQAAEGTALTTKWAGGTQGRKKGREKALARGQQIIGIYYYCCTNSRKSGEIGKIWELLVVVGAYFRACEGIISAPRCKGVPGRLSSEGVA